MDRYNEMPAMELAAGRYRQLMNDCQSLAGRFDSDYAEGLCDATGFTTYEASIDSQSTVRLEFEAGRHFVRPEGRWRDDEPDYAYMIRSQISHRVELAALPVEARDAIFEMFASEHLRDTETDISLLYEQVYLLSDSDGLQQSAELQVMVDGMPVPFEGYSQYQSTEFDDEDESDDELSRDEMILYDMFSTAELEELIDCGRDGFRDSGSFDLVGYLRQQAGDFATLPRTEHFQRIGRLIEQLQASRLGQSVE